MQRSVENPTPAFLAACISSMISRIPAIGNPNIDLVVKCWRKISHGRRTSAKQRGLFDKAQDRNGAPANGVITGWDDLGVHRPADSDGAVLSGQAYDLLDGTIYGEARLVWSSDLDGKVGRGNLVFAGSLTPGRHTITLTATNSRGLASAATVSATIGE